MAQIPVYEQQIKQATPTAAWPSLVPPTDLTKAAEYENAAVNKYSDAVNKIGTVLSDRIIEYNKYQADVNVAKNDIAFRSEVLDMLHNPEDTGEGKPKGILLRRLDQTTNSLEEFNDKFDKLSERYLKSLPSTYQTELMQKSISEQRTNYNDMISKHVASEQTKSLNTSIDSYVNLLVASASDIKDPDRLIELINSSNFYNAKKGMYNGVNDMTIKDENYKINKAIAQTAINAVVESNADEAIKIYEGVKGYIKENDLVDLQKIIAGKTISERAENIWELTKGNRIYGGYPNERKILAAVDGLNLNQNEKDKIKSVIKAKISDERTMVRESKNAEDHAFQNKIYNLKNSGIDQASALKVVSEFSTGNAETDAIRTKFVDNVYRAGKVKVNNAEYNQLVKMYIDQDENLTPDYVRDKFKQGKISASQYSSVISKMNTKRTEEETKIHNELVKYRNNIASSLFTEKSQDKKDFIEISNDIITKVKKREDLENAKKEIDSKVKREDPSAIFFKGNYIFQKEKKEKTKQLKEKLELKNQTLPPPQAVTNQQSLGFSNDYYENNKKEIDKLYKDLGEDAVMSMWRTAKYNLNSKGLKNEPNINQIYGIIGELGGYAKVTKDSKTLEAIRYLGINNKPVTPQTVDIAKKILNKRGRNNGR